MENRVGRPANLIFNAPVNFLLGPKGKLILNQEPKRGPKQGSPTGKPPSIFGQLRSLNATQHPHFLGALNSSWEFPWATIFRWKPTRGGGVSQFNLTGPFENPQVGAPNGSITRVATVAPANQTQANFLQHKGTNRLWGEPWGHATAVFGHTTGTNPFIKSCAFWNTPLALVFGETTLNPFFTPWAQKRPI